MRTRRSSSPTRPTGRRAGANGAAESLYLTLAEVTDSARKFADNHNIRLVQGPDLARLVPFNSIKGTPK
jgi:Restriction endonuclease